MRDRLPQPRPLDLPPVNIIPIRVYGQLTGPMRQPEAGVKIILRAITTNQQILQETWSETTTDSAGNYDFQVYPGKYAVFFERRGKKERINNIHIYSDSEPGNLQSFFLAASPDQLTPLMVLETKAAFQSATAAMLRSREWAEKMDGPIIAGDFPEYSARWWAAQTQSKLDTDTNINWRGAWNATVAYSFRDAVSYGGSSYYCVEANADNEPPDVATADNEFWSLMASRGEQGEKGEPGDISIGDGVYINGNASDPQSEWPDVNTAVRTGGTSFVGQYVQNGPGFSAVIFDYWGGNVGYRVQLAVSVLTQEEQGDSRICRFAFRTFTTNEDMLFITNWVEPYSIFNPPPVSELQGQYNRMSVLQGANSFGLLSDAEKNELKTLLSNLIKIENKE